MDNDIIHTSSYRALLVKQEYQEYLVKMDLKDTRDLLAFQELPARRELM